MNFTINNGDMYKNRLIKSVSFRIKLLDELAGAQTCKNILMSFR